MPLLEYVLRLRLRGWSVALGKPGAWGEAAKRRGVELCLASSVLDF